MCLILFAYQQHPQYKLIVAANRDEFYGRPTLPIHYWEDQPDILAGRDLEKLGTWMGVTKTGRFAALTNYRNPQEVTEGKRSRGELVKDALTYIGNPLHYMQNLANNKDQYPGYNLLVGDIKNLYYYSNMGQELIKIEPGIYGVSNHLLNTDWPKVSKGKVELSKMIYDRREFMVDKFFSLLSNSEISPDEQLPNTGVPLEMERMLSPLFIKSENYGTRSSTVLLISEEEIHYVERVYSKEEMTEQTFTITL